MFTGITAVRSFGRRITTQLEHEHPAVMKAESKLMTELQFLHLSTPLTTAFLGQPIYDMTCSWQVVAPLLA